jgi:hypothetical protein
MLGKEDVAEESEPPAPGAPTEDLEFMVRHALGKIIKGANCRSATLCQGSEVPSRVLGVWRG